MVKKRFLFICILFIYFLLGVCLTFALIVVNLQIGYINIIYRGIVLAN